MMETLIRDARFAVRQLRKSPGFAAIAVITLALGIAVNTTMFSLVSGFLLQRPPGREPERVAVISSVNPNQGFLSDASPVSVPNYLAWRRANHAFEDIAAADEYRTVTLGTSRAGRSEAVQAAAVSPNYFDVFGVVPQLGRAFANAEDQGGRDHVLVLSHDLWRRHFDSDPAIVGRTIRLNRENWTVIGVMPASFRLLGFIPQLWIPLTVSTADQVPAARNTRSLTLFARLKRGVTVQQANAEFSAVSVQTQKEFPEIEKGWAVKVRTLSDFLAYNFQIRAGITLLMTAVGFVLMIACANVAGLLLARAAGRQKELAIRLSLGARRFDLLRQLLVEGFVVAFLGGAMGLLLSHWGIQFVRASLNFAEVISAVPFRLDANVLFFALAISCLSAVLCSLVPALKASRHGIAVGLNEATRGSSSGPSQSRLRKVLVIGEVALALFLLVGTGLLLRAFYAAQHQDLGFQPGHLLTAGLTLDKTQYGTDAQRSLFVQQLTSALQEISGTEAAAVASDLPASGPGTVTLKFKDQPDLQSKQHPSVLHAVVSADYFRAAGISLLRGRVFTENDDANAPRAVIVNQQFVRRFFHDQQPLGRQIQLDLSGGASPWCEIVGVVGDVRTYSAAPLEDPEVYEAYLQHPIDSFSLMLRAKGDPGALAASVRSAVAKLDNELPISQMMTMPALIERQAAGNPFFMKVMAIFACLALMLAAIGIYGLIAYSVSRRTHEIGIRMALGAKTTDVLTMILRDGFKLAAIGGTIGLILALPLPKLFNSSFAGLGFQFSDPRLFVLVPALILLVAFFATYIPARRAGKVDPNVALRYE